MADPPIKKCPPGYAIGYVPAEQWVTLPPLEEDDWIDEEELEEETPQDRLQRGRKKFGRKGNFDKWGVDKIMSLPMANGDNWKEKDK